MSIKDITKSSTFVLVVFLVVIVLLPFAIEQIGESTDLYKFPATKWVKGLFVSETSVAGPKDSDKVDWDKQLKDLKDFSDWADGLAEVKISIIRPEVFQIVRAGKTPATTQRIAWELQLLSDELKVTSAEVRGKIKIFCEPAERVFCDERFLSIKPLSGGKKGYRVEIAVKGTGQVGLSYEGLPPVYYDVKLRSLWIVPVASCRSAMKGRYEAAVFFPGMEKGMPEGAVISPGVEKCGYRILSVSDHCVWFEKFDNDKAPPDTLPHSIWPDFSRIETTPPIPAPGRLVFGRGRCFWPGDAIRLPSSNYYLMLDDLMEGRAVVFRLLDAGMNPLRTLLCVIVREKK